MTHYALKVTDDNTIQSIEQAWCNHIIECGNFIKCHKYIFKYPVSKHGAIFYNNHYKYCSWSCSRQARGKTRDSIPPTGIQWIDNLPNCIRTEDKGYQNVEVILSGKQRRRSHVVYEHISGQPVPKGEHIHHINHNSLDDNPKPCNPRLFLCRVT